MESGCSLPCSQNSATCLHTEPHQEFSSPPSYFLKIHFNIIFPSTSRFSKFPLSSCFPTIFFHPSFLSRIRTTCPAHHSVFDLFTPNNTWYGVQIKKLPFMYSSPFPIYLVRLRSKYLPQRRTLLHTQPMFVSHCDRTEIAIKSYGWNSAWSKLGYDQ
jgi:hypothetical protein